MKGRLPSGAGLSQVEPAGSLDGSATSIPDADTLIALMSAWNSVPGSKFRKAYPFFAGDLERIKVEYDAHDNHIAAVAFLFSEYADTLYWRKRAQAIDARSDKTAGLGPKGESAVRKDAPEGSD